MASTIEYYFSLPYTFELTAAGRGGWLVAAKELPGCYAEGDTLEEAMDNILASMRSWIEQAIDEDLPIPEPGEEDGYSGRLVLQLPRSLQDELAERAQRDGVSVSQYASVLLARALRRPQQLPMALALETE
jgi:antitoxin HicB